jgi:hypothetical protein
LYFLYYIRWVGTSKEFREYVGRLKGISEGIKGVVFRGVFAPSSGWNFAFLLETPSFDKGMDVYRTYMQKYGGQHPKVSVGKLELLFTLEEINFPQ